MAPGGRTTAAIAALLLASCAPSGPGTGAPVVDAATVTVASFDFPESVVVAEIYAQALADAGIPVREEMQLGPREVVAPALEQGLVDVVPEYLGTALASLGGEATADPVETAARLRRAYARRGVDVLEPAPASTQNGVVVTRATALQYDLHTVSDLRDYAATMTFGGPPECPRRPFCVPGLERVYGLRFERVVGLDSGGPLTYAALTNGEVDVALLFTTDSHLGGDDVALLEDDRRLQPAENVVPVVRHEAAERHGPRLARRLAEVSASLRTEDLIDLNAAVTLDGEAPEDVAAAWLAEAGLLG